MDSVRDRARARGQDKRGRETETSWERESSPRETDMEGKKGRSLGREPEREIKGLGVK